VLVRALARPAAQRAPGRGGIGRVVAIAGPQGVAGRLDPGGERLAVIEAVPTGAPVPNDARAI